MSGGGGGYADAFITLGDLLHKNSLSTINTFGGMQQARLTREQKERLAQMEKEMEEKRMEQTDRTQNMQGLSFLAQQRQNAQTIANRRGIANLTLQAMRGM